MSRVTQRCLRRNCIGTAGQTDTIVGLVLARGREMPCSMKVELSGANARQGKETVHLVGNRSDLVGRQGTHRRYWWSRLLSLTASRLSRGNDNGCHAS